MALVKAVAVLSVLAGVLNVLAGMSIPRTVGTILNNLTETIAYSLLLSFPKCSNRSVQTSMCQQHAVEPLCATHAQDTACLLYTSDAADE